MAIEFISKYRGFSKINHLGSKKEPFLFIISYDKSKIYVEPLKSLSGEIAYSFDINSRLDIEKKGILEKYPIGYKSYLNYFYRVKEEIKRGNTYLLNLTFKTKIETNLTLFEIFARAKAPYRLLIDDSFVCFSPECFVTIKDNVISTFPMKGTIDASIDNAKEKILLDEKESAEHTMIVDLMRNDLNIVASNTSVPEFRYIDKIKAGDKELLQVSSRVEAKLEDNWSSRLGDILDSLTPAGSITGTPKRKTVELIDEIEPDSRGLYSGIFGIYDGVNMQSAVIIRAISKEKNSFYYHSGGGITIDSDPKSEYQEMLDKIYLPLL